MPILKERIQSDIEKIASFNDTPGRGWTRLSYGESDRKARTYLVEQFESFGLSVKVDGVGNIRARLEGNLADAPAVMTGSHIDTVPHGGKFDGVAGVVGALETARSFVEEGKRLSHPFEVVVFVEEEGSNFMSTMAGSKALTGKYGIEDLKSLVDAEGVSMYQRARLFGLYPETIENDVIRAEEIKALLELHIEQGRVLESKNVTLGIVESIAGIKTYSIEMNGMSNHAGATPMHLRKNPMVPAARVICGINEIIEKSGDSTIVGTVGRILCRPNIPNIIPGNVNFTIDLRGTDPSRIHMVEDEILTLIAEEAKGHEVEWTANLVSHAAPVAMNDFVVELMEKKAGEQNIPFIRMNSGAVHDCSSFADITRTGMIFVPSIGGRSHVPDEETRYEDIESGVRVLAAAVAKLAE